jgi:hypothetical protein
MKFGYFDNPAEAYAAYVKGIEELCGLSLAEICPRLIRRAWKSRMLRAKGKSRC